VVHTGKFRRRRRRSGYDANVAQLQRRRFSDSQDVRTTGRGRVEVVELGDRSIARLVWQPGWRWSVDVSPIAGTELCQFHHLGYASSGLIRVQMPDGLELEIGPGEMYEIPPGHDAWVVGDEPFVSIDFSAMRDFAKPQSELARRVLSTILFTDIVDSTAQAVATGPARWAAIVSQHNAEAERVIDHYDGRLVKTTGDGVIGLFDSAGRAAWAALAIGRAVRPLGVAIRAAVHAGEVELSAGDVRGVAVHTAARMMALAGPGEVVVSATVRDLVDGNDLEFDDLGTHDLKGLPGQRQLYRLRTGAD
jgi:class 3 adenylate cyclase